MTNLDNIRKMALSFKNAPKLEKVIFHNVTNVVYTTK